jgi:purine-binding chemotaxis protein CheW
MSAIEPTLLTRILVLDIPLDGATLSVGLAADRVIEVAAYEAEEIEPAPEIGVPWRNDYIRGVVRRDGGFVVLFDLVRLLTSDEIAGLPIAEAA